MKRILMLAGAALALILGGCTVAQVAAQSIDTVSLNKAAYAARATYVGALLAAAEVVKLPRCEKAPAPCVPQAVVDQIRAADLVADKATQLAEDAARNSGSDPTALKLLVDNAGKAASLFKFAADTYNPKKGP